MYHQGLIGEILIIPWCFVKAEIGAGGESSEKPKNRDGIRIAE